jgi:Zn-dependent membrane protease YugP
MQLGSKLTGADAALKMLHDNGIYDVNITCVDGELTDHYNPINKTVNLSDDVYYGDNAAAVAVAAHECGHAVQHAKGYAFLQLRSAMVPMVSVCSRYMTWIIFLGIIMARTNTLPLKIGIVLFAATTLFSLVTLPVEVDASNRALQWMENSGVVDRNEHGKAKEVLTWAAMTYVVAALGSLAELLRLIGIVNRRDD